METSALLRSQTTKLPRLKSQLSSVSGIYNQECRGRGVAQPARRGYVYEGCGAAPRSSGGGAARRGTGCESQRRGAARRSKEKGLGLSLAALAGSLLSLAALAGSLLSLAIGCEDLLLQGP